MVYCFFVLVLLFQIEIFGIFWLGELTQKIEFWVKYGFKSLGIFVFLTVFMTILVCGIINFYVYK